MKNILVIGGAGYIGSHMVRMLAKQGYNPVVFDNLSKGHREAVANYPFELGDLGDKTRLTEVFKKYGVQILPQQRSQGAGFAGRIGRKPH